jgi:methyltransferase (TIGR00027 family)
MKANSPSITAELAAMMRAVAHHSKPLRSVINDPYARLFCGNRTIPALLLHRLMTIINPDLCRIPMSMVQVGILCALCRHSFMEREVKRLIKDGYDQLVLIGAGYDTKSLRLKDKHLTIFELDHPWTQKRKIEILKKHELLSDNTVFCSCDLSMDDPGECLKKNGISTNKRTIILAEGVFSYFIPERIGEIIRNIASVTGSCSMIFDYRHPLADSQTNAKKWHKNFKRNGEQYRGLLTKIEMNALLDENGFTTDSFYDLYNSAKEVLPSFNAKGLINVSEIRIVSKKI